MTYNTNLLRNLRLTIGNNIHNHRLRQKMPLRKLSQLSRVSEHMLDCYELGKHEIRLEELLKISRVLNVQVEKLVAEEGNS